MESNGNATILARMIAGKGVSAPSREEVATLAAAYPYTTIPAAIRLKRATDIDDAERRQLVLRVAAGAPGRDALFRLLDPDGDILEGFMPAEEPRRPTATTTEDAIDTFLSTYGNPSPREQALLEKLIFNPVPDDYAALLEREEAEGMAPAEAESEAAAPPAASEQDRLLDAFLAGAGQQDKAAPAPQPAPQGAPTPHRQPAAPPTVATPAPDESLSMSLAQVYIRRGRYDKAYDIIHALSLGDSKKSVYFADQLRFLQKLMLVERAKTSPAGN